MNKSLFKTLAVFALVGVVAFSAMGAGVNKSLGIGLGNTVQKTTGTYANSQVDTITFTRDAAAQAYAFSAKWADSVNVTSILLVRVSDGVENSQLSTDSLVGLAGFTKASATSTAGLTKTITLAPLADQYRIYITYVSSNNGVTSGTNSYSILKQYSK